MGSAFGTRDTSASTVVSLDASLQCIRRALDVAPGRVIVSVFGAHHIRRINPLPDWVIDAVRLVALNAGDSMPRGGPLDLYCRQRQALRNGSFVSLNAGEFLVMRIIDAGFGLNANTLDRIYDWWPVHGVYEAALVDRLREAHRLVVMNGGYMNVGSRLGYGTCVELALRFASVLRRRTRDETSLPAYDPA